MSFDPFIMSRGLPFRVCDIFDDVYEDLSGQLKREGDYPDQELSHIETLANKLSDNVRNKSVQNIVCLFVLCCPMGDEISMKLMHSMYNSFASQITGTIIIQKYPNL